MKCTSKKRRLTKKELRRRKVRRTLLLIVFLVIVALTGILSVLHLGQKKELDTVMPFSAETEAFGMTLDTSAQTASGFSEGLCVGADGITLDDIDAKENEHLGLFDISSGTVKYSKDIYKKAYPASITKIMTAIVALENGNLDDIVTVPEGAAKLEEGSTEVGFAPGDQATLSEMLHGLLIYSGNDAAMAIANYVGGGSISAFVDMMNEKAAQLGATGTHFVNPHGLHDDEHYTTAYDIYLMLNEAMKYEEFIHITSMSHYTLTYTKADGTEGKFNLEATDQYLTGLVTAPKGVTLLGGKTGTTSQAGACLAIMTQNEYGKPYVSVVLNAKTKTELYERMNQLLNHINS